MPMTPLLPLYFLMVLTMTFAVPVATGRARSARFAPTRAVTGTLASQAARLAGCNVTHDVTNVGDVSA